MSSKKQGRLLALECLFHCQKDSSMGESQTSAPQGTPFFKPRFLMSKSSL
jgi:hypothetical protein